MKCSKKKRSSSNREEKELHLQQQGHDLPTRPQLAQTGRNQQEAPTYLSWWTKLTRCFKHLWDSQHGSTSPLYKTSNMFFSFHREQQDRHRKCRERRSEGSRNYIKIAQQLYRDIYVYWTLTTKIENINKKSPICIFEIRERPLYYTYICPIDIITAKKNKFKFPYLSNFPKEKCFEAISETVIHTIMWQIT